MSCCVFWNSVYRSYHVIDFTVTKCAAKFGGLTQLLAKFPDRFVLESDPPFNHVSLSNSHFAAAYKLMVLEAGLSKSTGASAISQKPPEELERDFVRHTAAILLDAPSRTLKVGSRFSDP